MDFLKTIISRLLAAPLAAATGWLVGVGIIPPEAAQEWSAAIVGAIVLAAYGLIHKLLDNVMNPNDGTVSGPDISGP